MGEIALNFMNILANIFSLFGAILVCISTFSKKKEKMLFLQTADCSCHAMANLFIGSYTGCITNTIAGIRNFLNAKNKMSKQMLFVFSGLLLLLGFLPLYIALATSVEHPTIWYILQIFPPIASLQYTIWSFKAKSTRSMNIGLCINLILWIIHDIGMGLYPSMFMDGILILVTSWNIFRNSSKKKQKSEAI